MAVVIWLIIALAAGIIEAATVTLVSVWFAAGAVCAAIAAGFGMSFAAQCLIFSVVSAGLLFLTLPLCNKFRKSAKQPTNADMLIDCIGIVTEDINPHEGFGKVKVRGQIWSARSVDNKFIAADTEVKICEIRGAHLVVGDAEIKQNESEV